MEMDPPSRSLLGAEHFRGHSFAEGIDAAPAEDGDGGWLVSFVDILMLLLTLFVLLLAISHLRRHQSPPAAASKTAQSAPHHAAAAKPEPAPVPPTAKAPAAAPRAPARAAATGPAEPAPSRSPAPPPLVTKVGPTDLPPTLAAAVTAAPGTTAAATPLVPPAPIAAGEPVEKAPIAAKTTSSAATVRGKAASGPATPHKSAPVHAKPAAPAKPAFAVPADIRNQVEVVASASKVNLVVKDDVLFAPGSARLRATGRTVLSHIADLLGRDDYPVSVRGYTDDTPIHTARYPSNWELSAARATVVTRFLIARGIASDRLSAVGYGATRPRASNATAAGRARNRRVSLVVHLHKPARGTSGTFPPEHH